MKTQQQALPGNALKNTMIYLLVFVSVFAVSGCGFYRNFYRPGTKSTIDSSTAQKLQSVNKYFIIHFQNGVKGLENIVINGDTLNGTIVKLPEEHSKHLAPVSEKKNRVKQKDKQNTLMEVHLYSMQKPNIADTVFAAPLSSFTRADVYELNKSATTTNHIISTVGIVASVAVIFSAIAVASFEPPDIVVPNDPCNCPQVYVKNNDQYDFTSGLYSGAVYSTLERMDYLPLTSVPTGANTVSFKIANAKDEEQFINQVQLLQVNHLAEINVLADRQGNILSYQNTVAPLTASTEKNNDVKNLLTQTDEQYYSFENKANDNGFSSLELTFNKPADATNAKLLVHARNTYWGGLLNKDFINLFGSSFEKWRTKQEQADPKELAKWQTDQALPLMVYIKTDKGWKFVDYFPLIGNTASRDMIMEINTADISADKIVIKLETTYRFWDLDFAAIDYTTNQHFETTVIDPLQAIKTDGTDQKAILLQSDKQYTHLTGEESVSFEYKVAALQNTVSSYFLVSGGYYHGLETITGKVNYKELDKFRKKGAFDKFSREKYQEVQNITAAMQKK